jgi:hypothetical protein
MVVVAVAAAEVEVAVVAARALEVECGEDPLQGFLVKLDIPPGHIQ